MVSEINHDYIHWPLKEKKVYRQWKKESQWGQLFADYKKHGYMNEECMLKRRSWNKDPS